jgi:DNA repair protein RecO (recombination protein O)
MLSKTKAVVLHYVKYGETSIIVTLYTEKFGRLSCMVHGVRSKKAKIAATYFQPLSLLDLDLYHRQNKNLQSIKDIHCPFHYQSVPVNPAKSAIAIFLAEVLFLSLHEEESNLLLFSFLYHALQFLDTCDDATLFHHWFMFHLTRYLGFLPSDQILQQKAGNMPEYTVFEHMPQVLYDMMSIIAQNSSRPPVLNNLTQGERNDFLERMIRYYSFHIEGFSRLKSFRILQEVFIKKDT